MQQGKQIYFNGFLQVGVQDFNRLFEKANDSTFDDILPLYIQSNFTIKKLKWEDFSGDIENDSGFIAHTFWNIIYTYEPINEIRTD